MKKIILLWMVMIISAITNLHFAQSPTYILTVKNIHYISNTALEFDIYMKHTNSSIVPTFEYSTGQYAFDYNTAILNAGATITGSIMASDFHPNNQPAAPKFITAQTGENVIYLTAKLPAHNNAFVSSTGDGSLFVKARITATNGYLFNINESPNLTWRNGPSNPYTKVSAWGVTSTAITDAASHVAINSLTTPNVVSISHPTCISNVGSVEFDGLPMGSWTLNPGNIAGSTTSYTINNLIEGTYNYSVVTSCDTSAAVSVSINAAPAPAYTPTLSNIVHPTCTSALGFVTIGGLPITGTWTLNPGVIIGTGASTLIADLPSGSYNYSVTNASGCTSAAVTVSVNVQPITPSIPTLFNLDHPTCLTATGRVTLTGLPAGTWTLNPGTLVGTSTSTTVLGLVAGSTTNYSVTNSLGCTSSAIAVIVDTQPTTPSVPTLGTVTHPTCLLATGSVVLNGLPAGNWTLNPGGIAEAGTSTTISYLVANTTTNYSVTSTSGCTSSPVAVTINAQPITPNEPTIGTVTQPACLAPLGSVELTGLPAGAWTLNPGAIVGTGTTYIKTEAIASTYSYSLTNIEGCTSVGSDDVVFNIPTGTPAAPTGYTTGVVCNGTPMSASLLSSVTPGVIFSWTNSEPSIGLATSGIGNVPTFTAVNTGVSPLVANIVITTISSNSCSSMPTTYTITVNPTPLITQNGGDLTSNILVGNQWYFSGLPIATATNQSYRATQIGLYSLVVNNCFSADANVITIGIAEKFASLIDIKVYPNPNAGMFDINLSNIKENLNLTVTNVIGEVVYNANINGSYDQIKHVDLQSQPTGLYFVKLSNDQYSVTKKVVIEK